MVKVLKNALRKKAQGIRQWIDDSDAHLGERTDQEVILVIDLIAALQEYIRGSKNAYFQMLSHWLVARDKDGVVSRTELFQHQICDHIEDHPNHQELLKIVVKEMLRTDRNMEIARILARPKIKETPVFENLRNDRQVRYLTDLCDEFGLVKDRFGPVEEECLVLPCRIQDVLYVSDIGTENGLPKRDPSVSLEYGFRTFWGSWAPLGATMAPGPRPRDLWTSPNLDVC